MTQEELDKINNSIKIMRNIQGIAIILAMCVFVYGFLLIYHQDFLIGGINVLVGLLIFVVSKTYENKENILILKREILK